MARVVVAGGGIGGMASALVLARDGHDVVLLDRDADPVPSDVDAAWSWPRRSVTQFRMAHLMLPGGHQIVRRELPDVVARLLAAGGLASSVARLPPGDVARPDDDRFETVTGRRPSIEWAFATAVDDEPGIEVRRGAVITGFVAGASALAGVPHVAGVRLDSGEELAADLVVDATGRRSPTPQWLAELGARPPQEESEDVGFTYTGRFFRSPDGSMPEARTPGLTPCGSISLLTIPSDNGTWSATLYTAAEDKPLRRARRLEVYERIWRAFPDHAHWLDGEPISELTTASGVVDRTRHYVVDGAPVATGVLSVADAHACTNPSIGRGMTLGLKHTMVMRDAVRAHLDDPVALARGFDAGTEAEVTPWHAATRSVDQARIAEMRAAIDGRTPEADPVSAMTAALVTAAAADGDIARCYAEILGCLALPAEVLGRPGVFERVLEVAGDAPAPTSYGPDRTRLLELLT